MSITSVFFNFCRRSSAVDYARLRQDGYAIDILAAASSQNRR